MEELRNIVCFKNLNDSEAVEDWKRWSGRGRNRLDCLHHKERKKENNKKKKNKIKITTRRTRRKNKKVLGFFPCIPF